MIRAISYKSHIIQKYFHVSSTLKMKASSKVEVPKSLTNLSKLTENTTLLVDIVSFKFKKHAMAFESLLTYYGKK